MSTDQGTRLQFSVIRISFPSGGKVWRFAWFAWAWFLGSWLASQSLPGQDLVAPHRSPLATAGRPTTDTPAFVLPADRGPALLGGDFSVAACQFWHPPTPPRPASDEPSPIVKMPFRYGDFGASSYPIRYRATGYYQSRTDWVWK